MQNTVFALLSALLLLAAVVSLQVFLSRKTNKWLGLLLPFFSFLFSVICVLSIAAYTSVTTKSESVLMETSAAAWETRPSGAAAPLGDGAAASDGGAAKEKTLSKSMEGAGVTALAVFVVTNIPTLTLLGIYYTCRESHKKNKELKKMRIQDL